MDEQRVGALRRLLVDPWVLRGAREDKISQLATELGVRLPAEYVEFMRLMDGYRGKVGSRGYIDIMTIDDAICVNRAHRISETMPGLVLFGSDGGGEAFAFDVRSDGSSVVLVEWVGMDWDSATDIGSSLWNALERLAEG